ncbi:hypothetical protein CUZ56_01802 [Saezia sanguinis]|uniref:Uncharacterized protein n=1 Tax=Saezia sanguinis TaxID=1965230 RepID=A0A433SCQ2_9BURK|nr:hypothetical protein [Saezia sanguinis]RUS66522.1 hypothetical protein CUZ56_01802 [Saezia sanguinis]
MKMINVIKKGTVLALATLGLCLSVSASAESQWTKISGLFNSSGIETHDGDSFCGSINWVSHTHYIGPWRWTSNTETSIDCLTSYNYGKQEIWATHTIYCKEGGLIDRELFGCYQYKDATPSTLTCPTNPPTDHFGRPARGAVACNGKEVKPCMYMTEDYWSDDAEAIAYKCLTLHETFHANDPRVTCDEGWGAIENREERRNAEITAYALQAQCLQNAKEECAIWNIACKTAINGEISHAERIRRWYEQGILK